MMILETLVLDVAWLMLWNALTLIFFLYLFFLILYFFSFEFLFLFLCLFNDDEEARDIISLEHSGKI